MPIRTVPGFTAYIAETGDGIPRIAKRVTGHVYSAKDTGLTTPLACLDRVTELVQGDPQSNADGYVEQFRVNISDTAAGVFWVAEGYPIYQPFLGLKGEPGEPGILPGDKAKLDSATAGASANSLMLRGEGGRVNVGTPTGASNATTKGYVDGLTLPTGPVLKTVRAAQQVTASLRTGTYEDFRYEVIRAYAKGAPAVRKLYANDYDKAWVSGNFKPTPRELIKDAYLRDGGGVIANAGGFITSGTDTGRAQGIQIKDGRILSDFWDAGSGRGLDALGYKWDGSSRIYRSSQGDTAASMVADGVKDTFCFGPAMIINGVEQGISSGSEKSGRQAIGVTSDGDTLLVSVVGSTGTSGCTYQQLEALCLSLGMRNGIPLDGGGSVQTVVNGQYTHPSSDSAPRPLSDFIVLDAKVTSPVQTSWYDLPLLNGFTTNANTAQVKLRDGMAIYRGLFMKDAQTGALQASSAPGWAVPDGYQRFPYTVSNAFQYIDVDAAGKIILSTATAQGSPRYLSVVRYPVEL